MLTGTGLENAPEPVLWLILLAIVAAVCGCVYFFCFHGARERSSSAAKLAGMMRFHDMEVMGKAGATSAYAPTMSPRESPRGGAGGSSPGYGAPAAARRGGCNKPLSAMDSKPAYPDFGGSAQGGMGGGAGARGAKGGHASGNKLISNAL
jgi:hypothetical protein